MTIYRTVRSRMFEKKKEVVKIFMFIITSDTTIDIYTDSKLESKLNSDFNQYKC